MLWNCFRIIQDQAEQIALLKDEIPKLKGQKPRPKLCNFSKTLGKNTCF